MTRHTKIVATLGPASEDKSAIKALLDAGMNIARLNFSHGTYEQFKKIVKNIRELEKETGKIITIMQDLQGPKIRLGDLKDGNILVNRGDLITFSAKEEKGKIHIPYPDLAKVVKRGQALLIEDGLIRTKIVSTKGHYVRAKVISGGYLKPHKGVNIPDSKLPASAALTNKDKKDLTFGIKILKVDALAISFVEDKDDIERVQKEILKHTKRPVTVIAKIERKEALRNIKRIIEAVDGVMVARGDLGIETKAERVPIEQKRILSLARKQGKPAIIATQILQSMVSSPLATRAEISDAATAIFEHADAFMLSNETAVGKYPEKAVKTLARVASVTEKAIFQDTELFPIPIPENPHLIDDEAIALNACIIAEDINAKAIVVMTKHGFTARAVLKHRPKTPVIVVTNSIARAHALNFLWGIKEIVIHKEVLRSEEVKENLKKKGILNPGDDAVLIKLSDRKRSLVAMKV